MADNLTPAQRRKTMAAIRGRDTAPERAVRSCVHRLGFRFRLHGRDLAGSPDLVLTKRRTVIFVHGCFWHGHRCRRERPRPKTNATYWRTKVERNQRRDAQVLRTLRNAGWRVLVVWECQARRPDLPNRLQAFLVSSDAKCRCTSDGRVKPRRGRPPAAKRTGGSSPR